MYACTSEAQDFYDNDTKLTFVCYNHKDIPPQDDDFRWLLEEYRVSLFAQQLKTAVPVSAKRLADAWQKRVSAGKS